MDNSQKSLWLETGPKENCPRKKKKRKAERDIK